MVIAPRFDAVHLEAALPVPVEGEILVRNHYLSVDLAMRGWIVDVGVRFSAGCVTSDPSFRVTTEGPRDCRLGFECVVTLTLIPASGWHANREFPWRFLAQPDSGLVFETNATTRGVPVFSERTGHVELRGETAVVRVVVRPTTVGAHRVTGRLRVGICNGEWCRNAEERVSIALPVS